LRLIGSAASYKNLSELFSWFEVAWPGKDGIGYEYW
jgi:hypothetical protein